MQDPGCPKEKPSRRAPTKYYIYAPNQLTTREVLLFLPAIAADQKRGERVSSKHDPFLHTRIPPRSSTTKLIQRNNTVTFALLRLPPTTTLGYEEDLLVLVVIIVVWSIGLLFLRLRVLAVAASASLMLSLLLLRLWSCSALPDLVLELGLVWVDFTSLWLFLSMLLLSSSS